MFSIHTHNCIITVVMSIGLAAVSALPPASFF